MPIQELLNAPQTCSGSRERTWGKHPSRAGRLVHLQFSVERRNCGRSCNRRTQSLIESSAYRKTAPALHPHSSTNANSSSPKISCVNVALIRVRRKSLASMFRRISQGRTQSHENLLGVSTTTNPFIPQTTSLTCRGDLRAFKTSILFAEKGRSEPPFDEFRLFSTKAQISGN